MHGSYKGSFGNPVSAVEFASLFAADGAVMPTRIHNFLTLGPFVLETGGAAETEFLYERHKVLNCDYLASSGGEANAAPYRGQPVQNDYYGEDTLYWQQQETGFGSLDFRGPAYEKAIFVTQQRNCVSYAAFYVDCEKAERAILCYENSGCIVYHNGVLVDSQPYGRMKGLSSTGHQVALNLLPGRNLILFKIRTGYICDSLDHNMRHCSLYPPITGAGSLAAVHCGAIGCFVGTEEEPRQVLQGFVGAFARCKGGSLSYAAKGFTETIEIPAMRAGECKLVRFTVPAETKQSETEVFVTLSDADGQKSEGSFVTDTIPYNGFAGTEHVFSDFHFDTTYHQEQRVYAMGAIHITKTMIEELQRDPNFKATLSEVDYLHPYYSLYPEHRAALKAAFTDARAEADCFYNQPNDLTSSGEGFVRNMVYGQFYHRDVLGRITTVYAPGDVFGHFNQMSQVCKKGGCNGTDWGKYVLGLDQLFHHVSPDGTQLLYSKGVGMDTALRLGIRDAGSSSQILPTVPDYPNEGDSSWMRETLSGAAYSFNSAFMDGIIEAEQEQITQQGASKIEYCSRDLTPHHAGVLLSRTDFKQANRLGENLLITAEKFAAIASYYGAQYPEKALDKAWRQILCAQHHDSITGTNNEISFVDLMIEYREALELAAEIIDQSVAFLQSGVALTQVEFPVFVFNPHTWARQEPCEALLPAFAKEGGWALFDTQGGQYAFDCVGETAQGVRALFCPKAPALGYQVYYLRKAQTAKKCCCCEDANEIENEFFSLRVEPKQGGGIVSLLDKRTNKQVLEQGADGPANRVVVLREVPERMETQHEFYTTGHKLLSSDYCAEVQKECGVNYQRLIITVKLDVVAKVRQVISLYSGSDRVDMETVVEDYQAKDDLFTLTFPVNLRGAKPVYDDRFAPHVTGRSEKKLSFQTHQYIMFSHTQVAPANQWFELGSTVQLSFGGQGDINLGMTALIRPDQPTLKSCADALLHTLTQKAIPVTLYDDVEQAGRGGKLVHFNEDLRNTDSRFVLSLTGVDNEYEEKLLSQLDSAVRTEFEQSLRSKGSAVLFVRDADNLWQKSIDVLLIKADSEELLQERLAALDAQWAAGWKADIADAVTACEVGETEEYGVALLNTGTIACSVETGNLMNMMLFHTAEFYGNNGKVTGGEELVPEQKTHKFTYALYPHSGSYREAQVYRKAMECNDPLFSRAGKAEAAAQQTLPESAAFLSCSEGFLVTSCKAGGYPLAKLQGAFGTLEQRGFAVRGFEIDGIEQPVTLQFGFPIAGAESANLLEEECCPLATEQESFCVPVGSHSIETYLVQPQGVPAQIGDAVLGAQREPVEPTFIRSWEHDLGTMPMGYLAVAGFISRKVEQLDDLQFATTLSIVNNRSDRRAKGVLQFSVTGGFTTQQSAFAYDLDPGASQVFPVTVQKTEKDAKGLLRLEFSDDGQVFEDVYEVGDFSPRAELRIEQEQVVVTVINETQQALWGELSLATPIETWALDGKNPFALGDITPRTQKVEVAVGERIEYNFPITHNPPAGIFDAFYAAAKLMVNGRIYFAFGQRKGERHNFWSSQIRDKINAENGSLRQLLLL